MARPKPKVYELKLKISVDAEAAKLTETELSKIVAWANIAVDLKAIFRRWDKIEVKFSDDFILDKLKELGELMISTNIKNNPVLG